MNSKNTSPWVVNHHDSSAGFKPGFPNLWYA